MFIVLSEEKVAQMNFQTAYNYVKQTNTKIQFCYVYCALSGKGCSHEHSNSLQLLQTN